MPTLQAMHRALAKHPMLQVELFLLLDELVHTELCCMEAFIGLRLYGIPDKQPVREDDFASTMQIGIAQFLNEPGNRPRRPINLMKLIKNASHNTDFFGLKR